MAFALVAFAASPELAAMVAQVVLVVRAALVVSVLACVRLVFQVPVSFLASFPA